MGNEYTTTTPQPLALSQARNSSEQTIKDPAVQSHRSDTCYLEVYTPRKLLKCLRGLLQLAKAVQCARGCSGSRLSSQSQHANTEVVENTERQTPPIGPLPFIMQPRTAVDEISSLEPGKAEVFLDHVCKIAISMAMLHWARCPCLDIS